MRRPPLVVLVPLLAACAPALSTLTPAPVTPQKHFRGATALGFSVSTGPLADFASRAEDLAEAVSEGRDLTREDRNELFESATGLILNLPSAAYEVQARYGIAKRVDLGLRLVLPGAIRLDGRYQFLGSEDRPFSASIGLGLTYYSFEIPVPPPVDEVIEVDDFSRLEVDVPILFGWSGRIGHLWFGPKLMMTTFGTEMTAKLISDEEIAKVSGSSFYYGLQVGGALGYRYVWFAFELTIAGVTGSADLDVQAADVSLHPKFHGAVFYPAFGILFQF